MSYDGVKWDETAGYLSNYFYTETISNFFTGDTQKVPMSLLEIFQVLGLSEQEAKELTYNLRLQHTLASGGVSAEEMGKIHQRITKALKTLINQFMEQREVLMTFGMNI